MLANSLLVLAMFFLLVGAIGINRLPGILSKLLTSSLIDTMALILLVLGLILKSGLNGLSIRLVIVLIFLLLTNPVISHVITAAAYNDSQKEKK